LARKILLADDSVTAQNMGRKILADAGYEVITVNNGSAALKKIADAKPDLIVLDVYMPGYSGLEVCQRLKEAQETARIPVLLTVGKLEPFKPEEAKRVRAEGFIVKPFEASELLSVLAKLEDKIVPRAEPSKPGRFARANAAIEESRFDKTVAVEEDSGWKNRIGFPSKDKKAPVDDDRDNSSIYNPVNKDLRTVLDRKIAESPEGAETRVDLGALAPEGLPKDVTPEEIAALAAAAAQVQGRIAESKIAEIKPADSKPAESKAEPVADAPKESSAATFAEQKREEKEEKKESFSGVASMARDEAEVIPNPTEVLAAIAGLEPKWAESEKASSASERPADDPVTMAVAAAMHSGAASRWTAVPSALAGDEATISLEEEMQKAYAAAGATASAASVTAISEAPAIPDSPSVVETPSPVEAAAVSTPASVSLKEEAAPSESSAPLGPATPVEVASIPVKEFERIAASSPEPVVATASQPVQIAEPVAEAVAETPQPEEVKAEPKSEAKAEENPVAAAISEPEPAKESAPEVSQTEPSAASTAAEVAVVTEGSSAATQSSEAAASIAPQISVEAESEPAAASSQPEIANSNDPILPHAKAPSPESEIADTTAAAWASWRRIRETGDAKSSPQQNPETESSPRDLAARAVAAGAEKAPEELSSANEEVGDIANIVDSVLADLRPKLMKEISRKMTEKK
jgi:CheY-like chemotaxis protein